MRHERFLKGDKTIILLHIMTIYDIIQNDFIPSVLLILLYLFF